MDDQPGEAKSPPRDPSGVLSGPTSSWRQEAAEVIQPLPVYGVDAAVAGTFAWAVAALGCLAARDWLAADGRGWWLWTCLVGAALGLAGIAFTRRRAAAYRAHLAADRAGQSGSASDNG